MFVILTCEVRATLIWDILFLQNYNTESVTQWILILIICIIFCSSCLVPVPTSWASFERSACISMSFGLYLNASFGCVHTAERQMGRSPVSYLWHLHLWIRLCYVAIAFGLNCLDFYECCKVNHGDNSLTMIMLEVLYNRQTSEAQ
jgi:hypothetical protein